MTTGRYQMKLPIGDGATRTVTLIDSDRNLVVDEIRVDDFTDVSAQIREQSPLYKGWNLMGNSKGFLAGGRDVAGPTSVTWEPITYESSDQIISFPFSAESTHTDVANLHHEQGFAAGAQSETNAYMLGGVRAGSTQQPPYNYGSNIQKFAFASTSNATISGQLTGIRATNAGHSSSEYGYSSGGAASPYPAGVNTIEKFPFSADGDMADVGDLANAVRFHAGVSSVNHGYSVTGASGNYNPAAAINVIQKFPFAADGNASDVGDLIGVPQPGPASNSDRVGMAGFQDINSGANYGFVAGGMAGPPSPGYQLYSSIPGSVQRFPFASDGNATVIGEINLGPYDCKTHQTGVTSSSKGYLIGGAARGATGDAYSFPFAVADAQAAGPNVSIDSTAWTDATNVPRKYAGTMGTFV